MTWTFYLCEALAKLLVILFEVLHTLKSFHKKVFVACLSLRISSIYVYYIYTLFELRVTHMYVCICASFHNVTIRYKYTTTTIETAYTKHNFAHTRKETLNEFCFNKSTGTSMVDIQSPTRSLSVNIKIEFFFL